MRPEHKRFLLELVAMLAFCAFLFFFGLGSFGLVGADEPRYAQIAREMFLRNDIITPTLHGQPWLEKPALYYWRAMFAYHTFGVHDWVARLPSATFATAMVVIIYFHMRRFRPGAQLDAALITASAAGIIGFARGASTDMQLAGPFAIAMLGWYAWYETRKKIWLFDFYFFVAVGTLAKGPVAFVLAALIVLIFGYLHRDFRTVLSSIWPPGIALFCVIVLPWFIAVQLQNPDFFRIFILEHNLSRFATNQFQHRQPFWFYIPVYLIALIPWTIFGFAALRDALRNALNHFRERAKNPEPASVAFPEFLVIWAIVPLLLFSISQSKLPGYILPCIPPSTILIADYLHRHRAHNPQRLFLLIHSLFAGFLVAVILALPWKLTAPHSPLPNDVLIWSAIVGGAFFAGTFLTLRRTGNQLFRFVTLAPVVIMLAFLLRVAAPVLDTVYSSRPIARELEQLEQGKSEIAVFHAKREVEYGLGFYRNQMVERYERNEIPPGDHLLIAPAGEQQEFARFLPGRRISRIGAFTPQRLEFFWISVPPNHTSPAPSH